MLDGAPPSKRSDLYALGVVFYEAIHGKTPVQIKGRDLAGFVAAVREGRRARPALPKEFPPGLAGWLDVMLAPDPADRPSSAIDALVRLNDACRAGYATETIDDRAARLGSGAPVGRDDERARLRAEIAPSPIPRLVWLAGEAGSGKSRLLRELAGEAVGKGWRVHWASGTVAEDAASFVGRVRADAGQGPTLVLVDEAERGDAQLASVLDRIAREPREAPVRVVAAVRPGEIANASIRKLLADVGMVPSLARVDLGPMDEASLKALIDRSSAGKSSPARVKWLLGASQGNAGAAEALLVEGIWEKHARVPVAEALEQSIRRRLDALSLEGRSWLEALAVLGDDAPESLVAEISGLEERAAPAAEEVLAASLARRAGGDVSPDSRRVAEAVRRTTPADRLRVLHAMAATHYAASERDVFGAAAWRLARLWHGAGDTERALAAALDAASASETATNWSAAAERYALAIAALPRRDARRGDLWMKRGEALRKATLHTESIKAFGWAARAKRGTSEGRVAAAKQARAFMMLGKLDPADVRARRILEQADKFGDNLATAMALGTIAAVTSHRFGEAEALRDAERALSLLPAGQPELQAQTLYVIASLESRLGLDAAFGHFLEAQRICDEHALTYQKLISLLGMAYAAERKGDARTGDEALRAAEHLVADASEVGWTRRVTHQRAKDRLYSDYLDEALRLGILSQQQSEFAGDALTMLTAADVVSSALENLGRSAEAIQHLRAATESAAAQRAPNWRDYLIACLPWYIAADDSASRAALPAPDFDEMRRLVAGASATARLDQINSELRYRLEALTPTAFEGLIADCERLVAKEGPAITWMTRATFGMLKAEGLFVLERFEESLSTALEARDGFGDLFPYRRAGLEFSIADALDALGRAGEARDARLEGKKLIELVASRIQNPDVRRDFLDQPRVRDLLAKIAPAPEARRLEALYEMIRAVNSEADPEALLASILELAMRAVSAERGMILLTGPTGSDFSVRLARNLERETELDVEAFSRRIVAQATGGESILALDAGQDERFKDFKSVSLYRIRSLMCVPLRSRGSIVGTVYLDSRRQGRMFSADDLRFVEAFADHAALALENAKRRAELEMENRRLRAAVGERAGYGNIVGRSPSMQTVFDLLEKLATSDATVLIQGESGTGKELVARAIHAHGPRKDKIFLSENCAAIPESLLETELFGHVRGAFTGADRDRVGLFEQAHGGTLFLDEVGDMSPGMQARLLRVLQDGELRRVGDDRPIRVDVRLITATNKDLRAEIVTARFREDLYYRLAVVPVTLPPLRERVGDVPLIAGHLAARVATARGRPAPRIDAEVLDALERYPWPGNVRQLENIIRRLILHAGDGSITRRVVEADAELAQMFLGKQQAFTPVMSIQKSEEEQVRRALEASAGNRDRAARLLGISRATIYRKLKEYGLH